MESSTADLSEYQWTTGAGAYFPGERAVVHGKDLFSELGDLEWMEFLVFGVCGRIPDKRLPRLLSAIWTYCASYPDPRLWNMRVGSLAGTARSTVALGVSAGLALSEATIFGHAPILAASSLLYEVRQRYDNGESLAQIIKDKISTRPTDTRPGNGKNRKVSVLCGFGRPISRREERLIPLLKAMDELDLKNGPMVTFAFDIEACLLKMGLPNMYLNAGGLIAALFCDLGLTLEEQYHLSVLQHGAGIIICAQDATNHKEGTFFPIRCSRIHCPEHAPRRWQRGGKTTGKMQTSTT